MSAHQWWQAQAQQTAFRALLDGFARPGTWVRPADSHVDPLLMFLSTLLDESVSLADPGCLLDADQRRLLLAPSAPVEQARFVLLDGRQAPDAGLAPALGTLESPEFGATLVLCIDYFSERPVEGAADGAADSAGTTRLQLQGPGVPGRRELFVGGLHAGWLARRAAWVADFPLGLDLVLVTKQALVALPRTTRIEIQGD
jgi:alpha-D-ribose 1-methylphosphonate 5-triphosphate synthase subunit PhnH